jgi:Bacterial SH3 domain
LRQTEQKPRDPKEDEEIELLKEREESTQTGGQKKLQPQVRGGMIYVLLVVVVISALILLLRSFFPGTIGNINGVIFRPQVTQEPAPTIQPGVSPSPAVVAKVDVDGLHLREGPGTQYNASYILPRDWTLTILGDYSTDDVGDVWVRVLVNTDQGPQEGWVNRRYIRSQ